MDFYNTEKSLELVQKQESWVLLNLHRNEFRFTRGISPTSSPCAVPPKY